MKQHRNQCPVTCSGPVSVASASASKLRCIRSSFVSVICGVIPEIVEFIRVRFQVEQLADPVPVINHQLVALIAEHGRVGAINAFADRAG